MPAACKTAFALAGSPLSPVPNGSYFVYAGSSGLMSEFVGTPADAPPNAVTYAVLSISARFISAGFPMTCATLDGGIAVIVTVFLSLPWSAISFDAITASVSPNLTLIWSGYALRTLSVDGTQLGLRTSVPPRLAVHLPCSMYGPSENGVKSIFAPVSLSWRTAANAGSVTVSSKSATEWRRWKTILFAAGHSTALSYSACPFFLYGPL